MTRHVRWHQMIVLAAGLSLVMAPYTFDETALPVALWSTAIGGLLIAATAALGAISATTEWEGLAAFAGLLVFLGPWIGGYTDLTGTAWTSWIVGAAVGLSALDRGLEATVAGAG